MQTTGNDLGDSNVRVAVRCRPFSSTEKANGEVSCVTIFKDRIVLANPNNASDAQSFAFDLIFDQSSFQASVWDAIGSPILAKAFDGYNGTIFAYGQTGSGKTWSMQGGSSDGDLQGIIPRLNTALFDRIAAEKLSRPSMQFLITASYFEIYNEFIFDLLDAADRKKKPAASKGGLEIKEHPVLGVYVKGLQEFVVESAEKLQKIIDQGMQSRTVASTHMNADSSRSHSVFVIMIRQKDIVDETKNVFAKVNLVDLAGSERVKSTGASGATLKEGANINKSLSELGNVINALVAQAKGKKGVFVPYRNSKLTRVLQESLGGNSITAMLAALSPAASYFEETMSTLKYANRAKAIKVNAVKNEEASQVSKLNDEIKQLRERLEGQQSNVDTSMLEEKHRQQLLDLEEAMKSTWEAKSKVSERNELERVRLQNEQKAAALILEANKKRNWRLLEEKGDLELSLDHVREISLGDARIAQYQVEWSASLKGVALLEQSLSEHYTVVQVYRSALERDKKELMKFSSPECVDPGSAPLFDKATLSLWRQFSDKIAATQNEVISWTSLQTRAEESILQLSQKIITAVEKMQFGVEEKETVNDCDLVGIRDSEVLQGLRMLSRQVKNKLEKNAKNQKEARKKLSNISIMSDELASVVEEYGKVILQLVTEEQRIVRHSKSGDKSSVVKLEEMLELLDKMKNCTRRNSATRMSVSSLVGEDSDELPRGYTDYELELSSGILYSQTTNTSNTVKSRTGGTSVEYRERNVAVNGDVCWAVGMKCALSCQKKGEQPFCMLKLKYSKCVTSIFLQGGMINDESDAKNDVCTVSNVQLPCGVTLSNCNGDVALTSASLGGVISWTALLRKTPPEKFLQRPPVRFLFDLFVHCAVQYEHLFPQSLRDAQWDLVGESKQAKLNFMNIMIDFLSGYLGVSSPATPSNIVSGQESTLTNTLLQHLAIAIQWHSIKISTGSAGGTVCAAPAWPVTVSVHQSTDGVNWQPTISSNGGNEYDVLLSDAQNTAEITVTSGQSDDSHPVRYLRIHPLEWATSSTKSSINGDIKSGFSVRASVRTSSKPAFVSQFSSNVDNCVAESDSISTAFSGLQDVSAVIVDSIAFLSDADKHRKSRKQEEVRKQMESLANEKRILELKLASDKRDAVNEKESLADRLKDALERSLKAESMYEQEKALSTQLALERDQIEEERQSAQIGLQQQLDQSSALKSELLKFEATNEKNRILIESLRSQIAEDEKNVILLNAQRNEARIFKDLWDSERDDFACQVSVLTEERDAAQSSEEELFERLSDRTLDLEILQESYVDMTDRCNDANDEISELREQLYAFQVTMKERSAAFSSSHSTSDLMRKGSMGPTSNVKTSVSGDDAREDCSERGKRHKDKGKEREKHREKEKEKDREREMQKAVDHSFSLPLSERSTDMENRVCASSGTSVSQDTAPILWTRETASTRTANDDSVLNSEKGALESNSEETSYLSDHRHGQMSDKEDEGDLGYDDEFEDDS